jgi:hypothetical protein
MEDVNISKYRAQVVRAGSTPASPGFVVSEGQNPVDPSGSGQNHLPVTIATAATGLSITESQVLGGAGTVGQYIRGDGSLADFPATTGGGSSVSYYLNGSVSQGTIGGVAYKELNRTPVFGAGTDISINADGYIASFITDALDPNKLLIPGGNWNFETYFSASSSGGSPSFYVELYKYDGTTFTLLATSSSAPELIAFGTNLNPYFSTLAVPETVLALTDRLAVRFYVTHSGRTITLHTEDNHLCQVITTFTTGLTALNGLTNQVQFFAVGTSGTDFAISSASDTHTFNLPTASATNRGALSSADWSTFNGKQNALTLTTTGTSGAATLVGSTLNIPQYQAAGTYVTAVTASSPLASSGGTTPNITIQQASGSQNGFLSSTDWTTFNNKQNALTNPVTGTGTANYVPKFTGSTTIGNSNLQDSGSLVTINSETKLLVGANATRNLFFGTSATNYGRITYNDATGELAIGTMENYSLLFATQNTTKMTLTSGGNLLVGTTTDAGFKLDVNGTGRFSGRLLVSHATSGNYGAVIYNTSATGEGLTVRGGSTSSHSALIIQPYDGSVSLLNILATGAATFSSSVRASSLALSGTIANSGDAATLTIKQASTTYTNGIYLERAGERNGYYMYIGGGLDALTFRRNYFGTQSDVMSLTRDGNVGIGTSSPTNSRLLIAGTHVSGNSILGVVPVGNNVATIGLYNSSNVRRGLFYSDTGFVRIESDADPIQIYAGGVNGINVTTSGNVLIGTTTDAGDKLQVNGAIKTSAPSGGTAGSWKFGTASSGSFSVGGRVRIEINGVAYDLLTT